MRPLRWLVTAGVAVTVVVGLIHSNEVRPGVNDGRLGARLEPVTEVTLSELSIDGAIDRSTSVVGNGGRLVLGAGYSVRSTSNQPLVEARLERRSSSSGWLDTGVTARPIPDGPFRVTTPAYSTDAPVETVQYRLATATSVTDPVSIKYENQRFYAGAAARIFAFASAYCPNTAVHVDSLPTDRAGDFQTGSLLIRVSNGVGINSNLEITDQRSLALHECAHQRQWVDWGGTSTGRDAMTRESDVLFHDGLDRGDPVEHAADCAASSLNPQGYLGYGGTCSTVQLESGRRLLLGQRY